MQSVDLPSLPRPFDIRCRPPVDSAAASYAICAAAMGSGQSVITDLPDNPDIRTLVAAISQLGVECRHDQDEAALVVHGCSGHWPVSEACVDCTTSKDAALLMAALATIGAGQYSIAAPPEAEAALTALNNSLTDLHAVVHMDRHKDQLHVAVSPHRLRGGRTTLRSSDATAAASLILAATSGAQDSFIDCPSICSRSHEMRQFLEMIDAFGISCVHSQDNRVIVPALQFFRSTSIAVPLDSRAVGWLSMVAAATASRIVFDCPNSDTGSLLTSPVIDVLKQLGHAVQFSSNSITIAPEKPGQAHDSVIMRADEPEIDLLSTVACIHAAGKPGRIENLSKLPPDVHGSLEDLVDALNNAGGNLTCDRQSLIIPADKPTHAANLDARNNADLSAPLALVGLCHRHASIVRCPPMPQWLRSAIRMITNL